MELEERTRRKKEQKHLQKSMNSHDSYAMSTIGMNACMAYAAFYLDPHASIAIDGDNLFAADWGGDFGDDIYNSHAGGIHFGSAEC